MSLILALLVKINGELTTDICPDPEWAVVPIYYYYSNPPTMDLVCDTITRGNFDGT